MTKKKNEDRKQRDFCKNKLPEIYARPRVLLITKFAKLFIFLEKNKKEWSFIYDTAR